MVCQVEVKFCRLARMKNKMAVLSVGIYVNPYHCTETLCKYTSSRN